MRAAYPIWEKLVRDFERRVSAGDEDKFAEVRVITHKTEAARLYKAVKKEKFLASAGWPFSRYTRLSHTVEPVPGSGEVRIIIRLDVYRRGELLIKLLRNS
jgi:hypothetical protein